MVECFFFCRFVCSGLVQFFHRLGHVAPPVTALSYLTSLACPVAGVFVKDLKPGQRGYNVVVVVHAVDLVVGKTNACQLLHQLLHCCAVSEYQLFLVLAERKRQDGTSCNVAIVVVGDSSLMALTV